MNLQNQGSTPLQSADGSMLIKDQEGIRKRWAEHFSTLLNKPSTVESYSTRTGTPTANIE